MIAVATGALDGGRLVSVGAAVTVNMSALLSTPPTLTTMLPMVAPAAMMLVVAAHIDGAEIFLSGRARSNAPTPYAFDC